MKQTAFIVGIVFLVSCAGEPEKIHLRTEKGSVSESIPVTANSMLTVSIKGMTCEMGCGGAIRKGLKGTGAVARVQYDWKEDEKVQKAYVSFDSSKTNEEELINILTKLNDGQFTVGQYSTTLIESSGSSSEKTVSDDTKSTLEMNNEHFEFPNLLNILRDLVVG